MTIQVNNPAHGKSKAALQTALNNAFEVYEAPGISRAIHFYDPSIFEGSRGSFSALTMARGESFPVVMDPAKRMRFALVKRLTNGTFKVS